MLLQCRKQMIKGQVAFGSGPFASQSRLLLPGYQPLSLIAIVNGESRTGCLGTGLAERKKMSYSVSWDGLTRSCCAALDHIYVVRR